jgi:hypothetical protein
MTAQPLPDDPADWPDDAHELLGVPPQADRNELRRAYTCLLRIYKPEHAPEAFRRLRQAYEQALVWADYQARYRVEPEPSPEHDMPVATPLPRPNAIPTRSVEEQASEAWSAWQDDPEGAWRRLLGLHERHPQNQDVYARLYWLLKLRPELDAGNSPGDWLARGLLARDGAIGPLRELYRRELLARPGEALSERSTQLLQAQHDAGRLLDLAGMRWRAAARLEQFDTIHQDLEALRPRWERADPDTWLRLLLAAVDELAWWPEAGMVSLFDAYCGEINRLETIKVAQFDALARLDLLRDLSVNFHRLSGASHVRRELRELVARSWTTSSWELEGETIRIVAPLARQPNQLLAHFDGLHALCPGLLAQLGGLLEQAAMSRGTEADWSAEVRDQLVRDMVDQLDWQDYNRFRARLVQFCVEELVSPELAAQTLQADESYGLNSGKHLADAILTDWPLRYVYQAHKLLLG